MRSAKARLLHFANKLLDFGNRDFCPWMNRYVYWLKQPIGWFIVCAFGSALTAIFLAPHAWFIFAAIVAVMLLGVIWPWVAIRGTTAEISFDCQRCSEADVVQIRLAIHNRWPLPLWGLAVENGFFFHEERPRERPVTALARVPGWAKSEFVFDFRPERRGVFPNVTPNLVTGFPFGICRAQRKICVQRDLIVWLRTTSLPSIPSIGGDVNDVVGMLFDRSGDDGDTIGVRPFQEGDRLRSIHWAQTARRGTFIVTERQSTARRLVVISLDLESFKSEASEETFETSLRIAASLAREFHARHAQVQLAVGSLSLVLAPGNFGWRRLMDALAQFQMQDEIRQAQRESVRDALEIVVTSSATSRTQSSLDGRNHKTRYVLVRSFQHDEFQSAEFTADSLEWSGDKPWIQIDTSRDYEQQLCQQWERVCHDSSAT